jgi:archaeal flagellar protein FlaG
MGFSLSGTHVVYFVAAVIVAGVVSGVLVAVTNDVSSSLAGRGDRIQEELDTEFKIINDPDNIPNVSGFYRFYLKNIGGKAITTANKTFTLLIDGDIISGSSYTFDDTKIQPGEYTIMFVSNSVISAGDHKIRLVGPRDVKDEFNFEIT